VVWRNFWLPGSETFIQDQISALESWHCLKFGVGRSQDSLDVQVDFAPQSMTLRSRIQRKAFGIRRLQRKQVDVLRRLPAQVMHAHFGFGGVNALPVARAAGLPLVVTFHGVDVTGDVLRNGKPDRGYTDALRHVFDGADVLVAVSEFIRGRLLLLGASPEKIRVMPIGTPVVGPAPIASPVGARSILFVGRLIEKKGVDHLLAAVHRLEPPHRDVVVHIVGDGPERSRLESLSVRLGVNATFHGMLPRDVAFALADSNSIFCGPSRTAQDGDAEGFGMVFVEAGMRGLPVVSYRHGGVPEAVEHDVTGLLAEENDIQGLAAHLELLLRDRELSHAMGLEGRNRAVARFNLGDRTAALERLYDSLI
jgi:colanic acid/amylovoran biosynthesis glycosyltransferase